MYQSFLMAAALLAQATGGIGDWASNLPLALAGFGAALGVAMIGSKAAEATGRNPEASGKVLVIAIIGMALTEAIAIYALVIAFMG